MIRYLHTLIVLVLLASTAVSQHTPSFLITFDSSVRDTPVSGRLTVFLMEVKPSTALREPGFGPFYDDPQPVYAIDVQNMRPGEIAIIDDTSADWFPVPLSELSPGQYVVQAVLDQAKTASNWRFEEGNLFSPGRGIRVTVTENGIDAPVHLPLTRATSEDNPRNKGELWYLRVRSEVLSDFHERDVYLRAAIIEPMDKEERQYPVVYEVPGFGAHITTATGKLSRLRSADPASELGKLARNSYRVILDSQSPNGHHLFADSAVNGPVGEALVTELIPAIDASINSIPEASARLLRGHSSGGWSTIWLLMTYPETFGATWSTAPDPVDFSSFQSVDIYTEPNMYRYEDQGEIVWRTSYTDEDGVPGMTIRDENRMEEVMGPGNTSAQQWDSWLAVFGPRGEGGRPADLYDPMTGAIDRRVAKRFEKYDIVKRLRNDAPTIGPLLKERLHLVVGDMDNYDLDEAVVKLKRVLDEMTFAAPRGGFGGYIEIIPGADHSSVFEADIVRDFPRQMLVWLRQQGHLPDHGTEKESE